MGAQSFALEIYSTFSGIKDFGFKDQILRAVVSISNNIAEGYERKSNKELKQFLYISKGSAGEVRSMLYLALKLSYISQADFDKSYNLSLEISKMLSGFIKTTSLKKSSSKEAT